MAQAQAKLDEAMQVLSKEDPELWQQLKGFSDAAAASLGGDEEREREGEREGEGKGKEREGSIEDTLEDTFRRLKESTERIEVSHNAATECLDLYLFEAICCFSVIILTRNIA